MHLSINDKRHCFIQFLSSGLFVLVFAVQEPSYLTSFRVIIESQLMKAETVN